jgi:hypothetical protein
MNQILQNLKTGATEIADVPAPAAGRGQLLIHTSRTLVSAGTERILVDFGKAGWIEKARQQPEKVRQVIDKIRTDGLMPTVETVFNKLDEPMPMGYCNAVPSARFITWRMATSRSPRSGWRSSARVASCI